jgi:hypothetical protein
MRIAIVQIEAIDIQRDVWQWHTNVPLQKNMKDKKRWGNQE